jgi:non-ribosomal peptide synthetase component F
MMRHRNFVKCIRSLVLLGKFDDGDVVIQMARCSFDIHVADIVGTLIVGATLVMLHPKGNLDFDYLAQTLLAKQITMIETVPTLLSQFFHYHGGNDYILEKASIKSICSSGELRG